MKDELLICQECGDITTLNRAVNWIGVGALGRPTPGFKPGPGPALPFCSWECLARYAVAACVAGIGRKAAAQAGAPGKPEES